MIGWVKTDIWTSTHKQIIHIYIHGSQSPHSEAKKHKHENYNKHMTKQTGNDDPSSILIMINFTPKLFFLKS